MSNYYLCETCAHHGLRASPSGMWVFHRCEKLQKIARPLVMHDGIERPTDLCEHYERKGADGR